MSLIKMAAIRDGTENQEEKSSKTMRLRVMTYEKTKELLNVPDEEYKPPKLPFKEVNFDPNIEFGSKEIRQHFCIDFDKWTFLNHGAFGGTLKPVLQTVHQLQLYIESQPLRFVDRELIPNMVFALRRLAGFMSCEPGDIVLVSNATEATATVVKSLRLGSGDKVYCLNTRYYSVNKLLTQLKEENGKGHSARSARKIILNKQCY